MPGCKACGFCHGVCTLDHGSAALESGQRQERGHAADSAAWHVKATGTTGRLACLHPRGSPSWELTHCAGLVLIGQLLGLAGGVDVPLHLGQSLQELAGSQGGQRAAPGLLEGGGH